MTPKFKTTRPLDAVLIEGLEHLCAVAGDVTLDPANPEKVIPLLAARIEDIKALVDKQLKRVEGLREEAEQMSMFIMELKDELQYRDKMNGVADDVAKYGYDKYGKQKHLKQLQQERESRYFNKLEADQIDWTYNGHAPKETP